MKILTFREKRLQAKQAQAERRMLIKLSAIIAIAMNGGLLWVAYA